MAPSPQPRSSTRAPHGHDAFLLNDPRYKNLVRSYLDGVAKELTV